MRISGWLFVASCFVVAVSFIFGQPPIRPDRDSNSGNANGNSSAFVARMMVLDANKDGKLSKDEVTDTRLLALFERADVDHDGVVTTEELTALYSKESGSLRPGGPEGGFGPGGPGGFGPGGPGGFGPGGPGGPGGFGRGGPGGPGGFGPPPIGQVLPTPFQDMLQLTATQRKKIDALQKQVDQSLAEILTDEQKQQLEQIKDRGPGGFGSPPGGPPGPGRDRGGPSREGRRPAPPPE